jgi:hypothetical protein
MKVKLTEQQFRKIILKEQVDEEGTGNPIGYGVDNYQNLRVILRNEGLTTMPDADTLPETIQALNLESNNITTLDLTGYHRFTDLFLLNLTNNPIREINMDSVLMGLPSNLLRLILSYDPQHISEEELANFENIVAGIAPNLMLDYQPIDMEYV